MLIPHSPYFRSASRCAAAPSPASGSQSVGLERTKTGHCASAEMQKLQAGNNGSGARFSTLLMNIPRKIRA
jgi:hypothetical protein